ncbi:hypothetical protein DdX_21488 [Ditylenchus destructor]|uniref:Uncharacterized protein n=1 Tax=Ditylenchus destructor TaxID=166010 RepID=A0AAD4QVI1_9BILA|nr:hypothetical protein DdX_21488 [Ditylenchus destructor]
MNRVNKSTPHDTADIIALNEARQCISMLSKPLALISDMIEVGALKVTISGIERLQKQKGLEMTVERLQSTLEEYKSEKGQTEDIAAMFGASVISDMTEV